MKKYHAMIWIGVALVIAGAYRLIAPFSTSVGTIRTSCGNAIAYLDGQDVRAGYTSTLSVCTNSLRLASEEGGGGAIVGLLLFVIGFIIVLRRRRARKALRITRERTAAQESMRSGGRRADDGSQRDYSNTEVYEQFMRLGRLTRPRTVLSFFAAVFVALVAGSVVAISLFLKHPDLSRYIEYILVFDAIVAILLIVGVFVTITKDPARLMLSEIANQNSVALNRGRRRDDPQEPVVVRRIEPGEHGQSEQPSAAQYRRRWDDPKQ